MYLENMHHVIGVEFGGPMKQVCTVDLTRKNSCQLSYSAIASSTIWVVTPR